MKTEIVISQGRKRLILIPETELESSVLKEFHDAKAISVNKAAIVEQFFENVLILTNEKLNNATAVSSSTEERA